MRYYGLDWACAAISIVGAWLAGSRKWYGWAVSLSGESVWLAFAIVSKSWGLIPAVLVFSFVHYRNLQKWRKEPA